MLHYHRHDGIAVSDNANQQECCNVANKLARTSLLSETIGNSNLNSSESALESFCPELLPKSCLAMLINFSSPIGKLCKRSQFDNMQVCCCMH